MALGLENTDNLGRLVVQLVKRPTLGFGSGRDLRVVRSSPMSVSTLSAESA